MRVRWAGIVGGFEINYLSIRGTFEHFSELSNKFSVTFSACFDHPQMPWRGTFEKKS